MKVKTFIFLFILLFATLKTFAAFPVTPQSEKKIAPSLAEVKKKLNKTRLSWIENKGQQNSNVSYYTKTFSGTVFVTKDQEIVYAIPIDSLHTFPLRENFVNATHHEVKAEGLAEAKVNYFIGNDPSKWQNDIPTYETVSLGEIWKGIEVKLNAYGNNIEKIFCVKPGIATENIVMKLAGAKKMKVNGIGELTVSTAKGNMRFTKPLAWQKIDGKQIPVEIKYRLINKNQYGFALGNYHTSYPLFIDPLIASTFIGWSYDEWVTSMAMDASGNVFITGSRVVPGTYGQIFISKFNNDLSSLLASTFISGNGMQNAYSIAIYNNNVFVTGVTTSTNFPVTSNGYSRFYTGTINSGNAFIVKLNNNLSSLLASTYLGGSGSGGEEGQSMAIDGQGNIYITGPTFSANFPVTTNAYSITHQLYYDVFISKLNNDLTTLLASTFIGGNMDEFSNAIAIDVSGNVLINGFTTSHNYPVTSNAYDTTFSFNGGIFVSKLDSNLTTLLASTFIDVNGGVGWGGRYNCDHSIITDKSGNIYITGTTDSTKYFPTTGKIYDSTLFSGDRDVFISKFNSNLSVLIGSTLMGGKSPNNVANAICLDKSGNVFITGGTFSSNFPTIKNSFVSIKNTSTSNVFIAKFDSSISILLASGLIGGTNSSGAFDMVLDTMNNVFIMGATSSNDYPTTLYAYDTHFHGGANNSEPFISKLDVNLLNTITIKLVSRTQYVCAGDSIILSETISGGLYKWSTYDTLSNIYVHDSGWYVCNIYSNDTIYIDSIHVIVKKRALLRLPPDTSFCIGGFCLLNAFDSSYTKYLWSTKDSTSSITVHDSGLYIVTAESLTCSITDSVNVSTYKLPPLHIIHDISLCAGSEMIISANDSSYTKYLWYTKDSTSSITVHDSGIYIVNASNSVCKTTDTIHVSTYPPPSLHINDTSFCTGGFCLIEAINPNYTKYLWSTKDSTSSIIVHDSGFYIVTASNSVCKTTDTIHVSTFPPPALHLVHDTTICEDNSLIIDAKSIVYNNYLWNTGETTPKINVSQPGKYIVTASNGVCTIKDSTTLKLFSLPHLYLPKDTVVCLSQLGAVILDAGKFKTYYWFPTGERTQRIAAINPEIYIVVVTDSNTCIGSDTVLVEDNCPYRLYMPNAFTPNNDLLNETFKGYGMGIAQFEMHIFDRWGAEIFSTTDMNNGWNGTFKNQPCIADSYVWIVNYRLKNETYLRTEKGTVTLVK